jgi:hypothetical protein
MHIGKTSTTKFRFHTADDASALESKTKTDQWVQLFNGTNLDGWIPKMRGCPVGENFRNTFRVVDGAIQVNYDQYRNFEGRFGHLFYNKPYSKYILRIEYRFIGNQVPGGPDWAWRNSGVMIHGQSPESMDRDQEFPVSIEVQFLGGDGRRSRSTANLCTPGTNVVMADKLVTDHCVNSESKTYDGDQWVVCEIEVHGQEIIRHKIDGQLVLEYRKPQLDKQDANAVRLIKNDNLMLSSGTISLQSESHPVEFRKIELKELD